MARIQKYHTGIKKVIQHNIREFKDGKCPTNLEVNPEKTKYNYSLIRRGNTAAEIEAYRKRITKAWRNCLDGLRGTRGWQDYSTYHTIKSYIRDETCIRKIKTVWCCYGYRSER